MPWGIPTTSEDKGLKMPHRNAVFWNGLRMMFSMLLPMTIGIILGYPEAALFMGLGTLVVGISDVPGTATHRRIGMLIAIAVVMCSHMVGILAVSFPVLGTLALILSTFLLSFLSVYGTRGATIGASGMLSMVFALQATGSFTEILLMPLMIGIGGFSYFLISSSFMRVSPYRIVRQSLGENIQGLAEYLRLRADLYSPESDEETQELLMNRQIFLVEEQENIREILLKSRSAQKGSNHLVRALVMIFIESVDLFELSLSTHIEQKETVRKKEYLPFFSKLRQSILGTADELENLGKCISSSLPLEKKLDRAKDVSELRALLKQLQSLDNEEDIHIFSVLIEHYEKLLRIIQKMGGYYSREFSEAPKKLRDYKLHLFTQHQKKGLKPLWSNFTIKSIHFRHALRTALAMLSVFLIGYFMPHENYYWLLLTVVVIIRPTLYMTKKRMRKRVLGTLIGGMLGFLLLAMPAMPQWVLILILCISAWGSFTFNALNYQNSVIFTTLAVLLGNYFLNPDFMSLLEYRILDTVIAALVCMVFVYKFIPVWEYKNMRKFIVETLKQNIKYSKKLLQIKKSDSAEDVSYKLARKNAITAQSQLMGSFQRMLHDPKKAQYHPDVINQIIVLNQSLINHIAFLGLEFKKHPELSENVVSLAFIEQLTLEFERAIDLLEKKVRNTEQKSSSMAFLANENGDGLPPIVRSHFRTVLRIAAQIEERVEALN